VEGSYLIDKTARQRLSLLSWINLFRGIFALLLMGGTLGFDVDDL
jgi:hypothetical protein